MNGYELLLSGISLALAAQSGYSAALMLYAWEDEEKLRKNRVPDSFEPPRKSFTIMLPARHEEAVIKETIQRTVDLNYPRELVQILVVIEAGDARHDRRGERQAGRAARAGHRPCAPDHLRRSADQQAARPERGAALHRSAMWSRSSTPRMSRTPIFCRWSTP